jgi:hypothetical protein
MITNRTLGRSLMAIAFLATGGCSLFGSSSEEPPPIGISYDMVDSHGTVVGKVNFSPLGQGQVVDTKGNLIGEIVKPHQ